MPAPWSAVLTRLGIPHRVYPSGRVAALCVFHRERTPSLMFWPESGRFHCHGCQNGGDLIDFLVEYARLDKAEIKGEVARAVASVAPEQLALLFRPWGTPPLPDGEEWDPPF